MSPTYQVELAAMSRKQLLRALLEGRAEILDRLTSLESRMSQLTDSVNDLQSAIDGVAARLVPQLQALQSERDSLSADAQQAVAGIEQGIAELNALGTDPSTPVDTGNSGNEAPQVETPPI